MPFSEEEAEVLAFLKAEQRAFYSGDFDAFVAHWHHGPETRRIISGPEGGTRLHVGWSDMLPGFEEGFRRFPQNFDAEKLLRWENIQIQMSGDMAWVVYDQTVREHVPGMIAPPLSHETKIVQRFDGHWKLVCLIVVAPGLGREDAPRIELRADGRIAEINALARERLPTHPGLVVSGERLRAKDRMFDPALQAAIARYRKHLAVNLPRGFDSVRTTTVPLGEDDLGRPVFCWVSPEQERILVAFDDAFLMRANLEIAAEMFGLSPAQVNLAELLASGRDLASAAETLGVSVNTVRTQVRRMFEKTGAHSQTSLISLLLSTQGPD